MTPRIGSALCVLLLGFASASALAALRFERSAESRAVEEVDKSGEIKQVIVTQSFVFAEPLWDLPDTRILLSRRSEVTSYPKTREGDEAKIELEAFKASAKNPKDGYTERLWKQSDEAEEAAPLWGELVVTSRAGCCGAKTTYRAYGLAQGTQLFSYNAYGEGTSPYRIEIPNSRPRLTRYIGYLDEYASKDFPSEKNEGLWQAVGVISYAGRDRSISKILVQKRRKGSDPAFPDTIRLVAQGKRAQPMEPDGGLTLWPHEGDREAAQAFDGFSLQLKFEEGMLSIPVRHDRLEAAQAKVPAGFRLQALSP